MQQKWQCFGPILRFRWGTEKQGFIQIKNFFAEVFQIKSRFVLAKKIRGLGAL